MPEFPRAEPGVLAWDHDRSGGQLFVADCFAGRVQKFEPIPGADPSKMVGQILREYPIE